MWLRKQRQWQSCMCYYPVHLMWSVTWKRIIQWNQNTEAQVAASLLYITTISWGPSVRQALCASHFPDCYGLNVFVPPKFIFWSPNPQYDGVWRWGLWEVIRVRWGHKGRWDGICAIIRRDIRELSILSISPSLSFFSYHIRTQQEGQPCWHHDLTVLASRAVRNKFFLFKPVGLQYFVKAARAD